jgi:arginase
MGLAHMLAIPGHVSGLSSIGPAVPLLRTEQVVTYGDALPDDDHERRLLADLDITRISAVDVHGNTRGSADRALARVEAVAPVFVLHVDVDVLAFIDAPLADVPDSGGEPIGLTLDEFVTSLAAFVTSPRLAALVLTEVNPDHVPDVAVLRHFVERLTATLAGT